jgi:hypothetical protein
MELTKEQVRRIDKYLDVKGVKFIDFRIEIFDHIISQIEQKLEVENTDFETVFYQVTDEWNKQLNTSSSFLLGWAYSAPKTVIKKAKRIHRKLHTKAALIISVPLILGMILNLSLFKTVLGAINSNSVFITVIFSIISGLIIYKSRKETDKTVYNFLIKTQEIILLLGAIIVFMYSFNVHSIEMLIFFTFYNCYLILLHFKHQQEKEKYKLLVEN